ncbi:hypothetical protein, partial [Ovoidimarina sediminis]|uniref:hypothetical protein n=1 Tax=Ovoidimarina sediminis TaxID=3079856 RepID=UPI002930A2B4
MKEAASRIWGHFSSHAQYRIGDCSRNGQFQCRWYRAVFLDPQEIRRTANMADFVEKLGLSEALAPDSLLPRQGRS